MSDVIYLASPYSDPSREVREQRFKDVCRAAGFYMEKGLVIYSPIAHMHPIAEAYSLPKEWEFWEKFDRVFLGKCKEFWILRLLGWSTSVGVGAETKIAEELGLPIRYKDPILISEKGSK